MPSDPKYRRRGRPPRTSEEAQKLRNTWNAPEADIRSFYRWRAFYRDAIPFDGKDEKTRQKREALYYFVDLTPHQLSYAKRSVKALLAGKIPKPYKPKKPKEEKTVVVVVDDSEE